MSKRKQLSAACERLWETLTELSTLPSKDGAYGPYSLSDKGVYTHKYPRGTTAEDVGMIACGIYSYSRPQGQSNRAVNTNVSGSRDTADTLNLDLFLTNADRERDISMSVVRTMRRKRNGEAVPGFSIRWSGAVINENGVREGGPIRYRRLSRAIFAIEEATERLRSGQLPCEERTASAAEPIQTWPDPAFTATQSSELVAAGVAEQVA